MAITDNTAKWEVKKVGAGSPAEMVGATASAKGKSGIVPEPEAGANGKFLRGDGTWQNVPTPSLSGLGLTATATELNYVDGVTSNIQTQLNGKLGSTAQAADSAKLGGAAASSYAKIASPTFTGTVTAPTLTVSTTLNIPGGKIWIG